MLSKLKYLLTILAILFFSNICFSTKNDSDKTYYSIMYSDSGFPIEKQQKNDFFAPFKAKKSLITFDGELKNLSTLELENKYLGQVINKDTINELCNNIMANFFENDYLFMEVKLDKYAMRSGLLKLDIRAVHIEDIKIIGPGAENKQMMLYKNKIANNNPAKKSFVKEYLWLMKRIPSITAEYQFVETENHNIELIIKSRKNFAASYGR